MAKEAKVSMIGPWAFLIGVILALVMGFAVVIPAIGDYQGFIVAILVILGLIIGFLNVTGKESQGFLMAGVSLVIVSYAGQNALASLGTLGNIGDILKAIMNNLSVLFVPTTVVVALKSVFAMAKD